MFRIFCESYQNFLNSLKEDSYRKKIAKPFELIVNLERYKEEEQKNSELFKKLSDLIYFMKENIEKFPKLNAFLWTLSSRDIIGKQYNVANKAELQEQTKIVNSFLKLAYWY